MIKQALNPNIYHGFNKKGPYFEGWYFKVITIEGFSFAFIPGVFLTESPSSSFSFIQVFEGNSASMNFINFPYDSFTASRSSFDISISENHFSIDELALNIQNDKVSCEGKLLFRDIQEWKGSIINPGSMGFYNYLPFMQCYSQVCALSGKLKGNLKINKKEYNFSEGKLYIEKNWGKSFPYSYIWCQCNYFQEQSLSVTCSIAHIPMPKGSFTGFLIGVCFQNKLIKFTSINKSKLTLDFLDNSITITSKNSQYTMILKCTYSEDDFVALYAPSGDSMIPTAKETITGTAKLMLMDSKTDQILTESYGVCAGIEFAGDYISLKDSINH